jgi:acetate kinase
MRDEEQPDRMVMAGDLLTLNAGASSLKFPLWHCWTGIEEASRVRVYVIPTGEERMIAEHTIKHIGQAALLS